jgi:hypothetical protein
LKLESGGLMRGDGERPGASLKFASCLLRRPSRLSTEGGRKTGATFLNAPSSGAQGGRVENKASEERVRSKNGSGAALVYRLVTPQFRAGQI